jgi:hypothetical protein
MAKPWEKLFNIFGSLFSRDLSQEIPDQTALTGAGIGRADSVGNSEYLENGGTFSHSVELTNLNDFLEVSESTDRRSRLMEYDRLENIPEIVRALDIFADEITTPDIEGKVFDVVTESQKVKEEVEWLFNQNLEIDTEDLWAWTRNLCKNGDIFLEAIINADHPELGILKLNELPPETIYRIETVRGRLLEFQQSYAGPDYQAVLNGIQQNNQTKDEVGAAYPNFSPVTTTGTAVNPMTTNKLASQIIRFMPEQIIHMRTGQKRRGFYPYGVSILYAARRIAQLLKLMEDAMLLNRVSRSPERRVFYIDIGTLPPHKGEMVLNRIKDKIKKRKMYNSATGQIDERWSPFSIDEDFFLPVRPESNTRIETLPGAQNLSEIDDCKYFREKMMVALNLPKNFLFQEAAETKTSLSLIDSKFAHSIYRIQKLISKGLRQIAMRHLALKGYSLDDFRDLKIVFTSPSDWMELTRAEVLSARFNLAASIKGAGLYDDFTILTEILKKTKEEALEIIGRLEQQTLRMQELNAQGQIFAQLTTPEPGQQQQQPQQGGSGVQDFMAAAGAPPMPQGAPSEVPGMPGMPGGGYSTDNIPEVPTKKKKKPAKILDFSDLEADEEEVDLDYEE